MFIQGLSENGSRVSGIWDCTLLTLALGGNVRWQAKANVCNVLVEKIKNTEESAMSVDSVAVHLQYGLYVVGHLSKLAFHFIFLVIRLFVVV